MGLVDLLLKSGNGDLLNQIAGKAGVDQKGAEDLLSTLGSAMFGQVKGRVESQNHNSKALEDLIRDSRYAEMLDNPSAHLNHPKAEENGIDILSYITGSKEGSREIASQVSEKTGVSSSIIKSLLPMIAPMIIGSLGKGLMGSSLSSPESASSSDEPGLLSSLLDFDKDGSVIDDVAGLAMKFIF